RPQDRPGLRRGRERGRPVRQAHRLRHRRERPHPGGAREGQRGVVPARPVGEAASGEAVNEDVAGSGRRAGDAWLFFLVFVTYAYFFNGGGWNQNAHFDLTRAIVEQRSIR